MIERSEPFLSPNSKSYPGEIEIRNEERNLRDGVQLPDQTLVSLAKLAQETDLVSLLP